MVKPGDDFEARIGSVVFLAHHFDWTPGVYVTDVDGLLGGGEVSAESIRHGSRAGVPDVKNVRDTPRVIRLEGFVYNPSRFHLGGMLDELAGLANDEDSDPSPFEWTEFDRPWRRALVRRFGRFEPVRDGSTGFAEYAIAFRAPDQRVYGSTPEGQKLITSDWGSSVTVSHKGNYPAPTKIEVRGSSPTGYTVSGPKSRRLVVTRAISSGTNHTYDSDSGALLVGSTPAKTGIGRSDSIEIPRGAHTVSVDNGCEVRVTFPPTYLP